MLEKMRNTLRRTLVIIIDERSMLTADVVGAAERNTSKSAHGGTHDDEDWGGVPVVIFVGDDYQLPPPTNKEKGAFDLMGSKTSFSQQKFGVGATGALQLEKMSDFCMELTTVKRQNGDQDVFKGIKPMYTAPPQDSSTNHARATFAASLEQKKSASDRFLPLLNDRPRQA